MSVSVGGFSLVLFLIAGLLHRFKHIETSQFLGVSVVAFLAAVLGIVLALIGFRSVWKYGSIGGKRATAGMIMSSIVLAPFIMAAHLNAISPGIADISTDLIDPPQLSGRDNSTLNAALQAKAYPDVTGRRYELAIELIMPLIETLIEDENWTIIQRKGAPGQSNDVLIEAQATTLVFGFTDSIAIRVTDEQSTSFVDMRSASGFGARDLGANATRIVNFLIKLDAIVGSKLIGQTGK